MKNQSGKSVTNLENLTRLAKIARKVFERVAKREGYSKSLSGLCYDASCFLRTLAKAHEIKTDLGESYCHFFVLYEDIVVDITSTQFSRRKKVEVISLNRAMKIGEYWKLINRTSKYSNKYRSMNSSNIAKLAKKELMAII